MMGGGPPHQFLRSDDREVKRKSVDRQTARRVWAFSKPYRVQLFWYLLLVVIGSLLLVVPPLLLRQIIDVAIPEGDRGLVTLLGAATLGLALVNTGLDVIQRYFSSAVGEGLIYDMRVKLFDHVQRMPVAFFTRTQTGALTSRLNNDVIGAQRALTGTLGTVLFNVLTVVFTITAMLALEWRLTLLSLIILPALIIPAKRVARRLQDITRESMDLNASMNATMNERFNVSGAMLVKLFGRPTDESQQFASRARRVADIGVRTAMYGRVFFAALGLVAAAGTAVVYWYGSQLVIDGAIEIGTLVAMSAFVNRLYGPLTSLSTARIDVLTAFVSFERVFEILDAPRLIDDAPDAVALEGARGDVRLDDVWFRYPAASEVSVASLEGEMTSGAELDDRRSDFVLRGVSADIRAGQLVALVGPSGAGKTTTAALVPRLYDVTSGAVFVDGHDVRSLTQDSLRAAIGVVSQDPHLFHDTIGNNLRYARPGATEEEVVAACRAAQIHDLIASLPDGYDTLVGERGYRLSGGEKQRVAIARMLLKDPAIVVLDEATSHLDAENEALVQEALATALSGRTSIVIAHRLSTIQVADVILVLDDGQIVERGTHRELLDGGGLYSELYHTLLRDSLPAGIAAEILPTA